MLLDGDLAAVLEDASVDAAVASFSDEPRRGEALGGGLKFLQLEYFHSIFQCLLSCYFILLCIEFEGYS